MNRSRLAFANLGANYEFNPTFGPVILGVMPITRMIEARSHPKRTRRWQFRLHHLFIFVALLCLTMAWWMSRRSFLRELATAGATPGTDWGFIGSRWDYLTTNVSAWLPFSTAADGDVTYLTLRGERYNDNWLPRLRRCTKLDSLHVVEASISNAGLKAIDELPARLSFLGLYSCRAISDDGLRHLQRQRSLSCLHLEDINLTGDGLRHLSQLPNLELLILENCTTFDGSTLIHLRGCKKLETLYLNGSSVTDADLELISRLPALKELQILRTNVTAAGIAKLKATAPHLNVGF